MAVKEGAWLAGTETVMRRAERGRSESFRGERPNAGQAIGFVLTLGGGIAIGVSKRQRLFNRFEGNGEPTQRARRHLRTRFARTGLSLRHLFFGTNIFRPLRVYICAFCA